MDGYTAVVPINWKALYMKRVYLWQRIVQIQILCILACAGQLYTLPDTLHLSLGITEHAKNNTFIYPFSSVHAVYKHYHDWYNTLHLRHIYYQIQQLSVHWLGINYHSKCTCISLHYLHYPHRYTYIVYYIPPSLLALAKPRAFGPSHLLWSAALTDAYTAYYSIQVRLHILCS